MDAPKPAPANARPPRRGFTLVEMLTVVVIIGILAGLATAVAMRVRVRATVTAIKLEIVNIESGIAQAKTAYHLALIPDGTSDADLVRFLAVAFPNYNAGTNAANFKTDLQNAGINYDSTLKGDSAAALVFWLGGMREAGKKELLGFSKNPRNPFKLPTSTTEGRLGPFFDFRQDRLDFVGDKLYYFQPNKGPDTEPYVYFKARADKTYFLAGGTNLPSWGNCKPCYDLRLGANVFANNKTFQIRAPGRDGKHGSDTAFGGDTYGDDKSYDDIANFSDGTFEDAIP